MFSPDRFAYALSDTEAARRMMRAKAELLCRCKLESPLPGPGTHADALATTLCRGRESVSR
jgi:hypothetical protein